MLFISLPAWILKRRLDREFVYVPFAGQKTLRQLGVVRRGGDVLISMFIFYYCVLSPDSWRYLLGHRALKEEEVLIRATVEALRHLSHQKDFTYQLVILVYVLLYGIRNHSRGCPGTST